MIAGRARSTLLRQVASIIESARERGICRVAIDGVDAAGKTMFADELATVFEGSGLEVVRVSVDGFHNPAEIRYAREAGGAARSFYEDSFDYESFSRLVLEPLAPGGSRLVTTQIFDHVTDQRILVSPTQVPADAIALIDGIFLGRPELRAAWDLWIFLAVDEATAMARGIERDAEYLGGSAAERYERRYVPGQALYLDEVDPAAHADVVIDNTRIESPRIMRLAPELDTTPRPDVG